MMSCRTYATRTSSAAPPSGEHAPRAAGEGPCASCPHDRETGEGKHPNDVPVNTTMQT